MSQQSYEKITASVNYCRKKMPYPWIYDLKTLRKGEETVI